MTKHNLIKEIAATYQTHGWELKSALLRSETKAEIANNLDNIFREIMIEDSSFDALWFTRASHTGGEAWELRLIAETPYALFERIGANEPQEKRTEVFKDMEEQLRQYVTGT